VVDWLAVTSLLPVMCSLWFLPRDAMHSTDCAIERCLSVHLSYVSILVKHPSRSSHFFAIPF